MSYRKLSPSDEPFLYATWLRSYASSDHAKRLGRSYWEIERRIITGLLTRCDVVVVCENDDFDHIIAYVVYEAKGGKTTIHYAYTKMLYREMGIMSGVLSAKIDLDSPVEHSHTTVLWKMASKKFNSQYKGE